MYMVYWTSATRSAARAHSREFATEDMAAALQFMESLRARQRSGEDLRYIIMASEHPDLVGPLGVADPAPGYNWKKRR